MNNDQGGQKPPLHSPAVTSPALQSEPSKTQLREQLHAAQAALEAAHTELRRKDEFITTLSHELRNPLASVRYSLYLLQSDEVTDAERENALEVMERHVGYIGRMVDDLLDISRVSRGKVTLQWRHVDLIEMATQAVEDHQARMAAAGTHRTFHIYAHSDEPLCVRGDPTRLNQIIGNILHNCVKFTGAGDSITLDLRREECDNVSFGVITIRDTGIGMTLGTLEHLFEPFVQGHQAVARCTSGLGLGLALVKKLIELHGGAITAHSDGPGQGAEFTLTLPLDVGPVTFEGAVPKLSVGVSRRILLVEDNHDTAEMMRRLLEFLGHTVAVAHDGVSALNQAHDLDPDIVLCDIGLPGELTGYDIAERLKETHPDAFLAALTGYSLGDDDQSEVFDRYLTKPVEPDILQSLILTASSV